MAISALEKDTVSNGMNAAKLVINDLKPLLDKLQILYDSAGGVKTTLTQGEIDSVSSWSELTKTQLDDGMYALTNTLKTAIDSTYTALAQLAARS